jgi:hypothetical protein
MRPTSVLATRRQSTTGFIYRGSAATPVGNFCGALAPISLIANGSTIEIVTVNDRMQRGYFYAITVPVGRKFDPEFHLELTPKEMLALGIFCGKYMTDCARNSQPVRLHTPGSRHQAATAP